MRNNHLLTWESHIPRHHSQEYWVMQLMHGGKKRAKKDNDYRCREERAVVVCPYSTAVISVSAWPAAQPVLTQISWILANSIAVAEMAKPGGKYLEQGATATQISLQANCFLKLVLRLSTSLSHSGATRTPLAPVAREDRLKPSSSSCG